MREFTLINNRNERWSLNDVDSFFHSINGLGQEYKAAYEQLGNLFIKSEDEMKQKNITGKICFSSYKKYEEFALFIQHKPLVLEYVAEKTYLIRVSIDKLNKSEEEFIGIDCDVAMKSMGTFYKPIFLENKKEMEGKKYPYTYSYTYSENDIGMAEIESNSTLDSPVRITILGKCKNPEWKHYINGILKTTGKVYCDIEEGNRLIISTEMIPWEIAEYTENGTFIRNCYENSDFSTQRFIMLGYGINKIVFSQAGEEDIKLIVEGRIEYETV